VDGALAELKGILMYALSDALRSRNELPFSSKARFSSTCQPRLKNISSLRARAKNAYSIPEPEGSMSSMVIIPRVRLLLGQLS
jgi:hypothetical protein